MLSLPWDSWCWAYPCSTIPTISTLVSQQFGLSNTESGLLASAFALTYTVIQESPPVSSRTGFGARKDPPRLSVRAGDRRPPHLHIRQQSRHGAALEGHRGSGRWHDTSSRCEAPVFILLQQGAPQGVRGPRNRLGRVSGPGLSGAAAADSRQRLGARPSSLRSSSRSPVPRSWPSSPPRSGDHRSSFCPGQSRREGALADQETHRAGAPELHFTCCHRGPMSWMPAFLTANLKLNGIDAGHDHRNRRRGRHRLSMPGGILSQRIGPRPVILVSMVLLVVSPYFIAVSGTWSVATFWMAMLGIGGNLFIGPLFALVPYSCPRKGSRRRASRLASSTRSATFGSFLHRS